MNDFLQGAVGLRMRIYDRKICFVNCHFAAHMEAVNQRNDDFDHVFRTMNFDRPFIANHCFLPHPIICYTTDICLCNNAFSLT